MCCGAALAPSVEPPVILIASRNSRKTPFSPLVSQSRFYRFLVVNKVSHDYTLCMQVLENS